jgi:hypothetical protein
MICSIDLDQVRPRRSDANAAHVVLIMEYDDRQAWS